LGLSSYARRENWHHGKGYAHTMLSLDLAYQRLDEHRRGIPFHEFFVDVPNEDWQDGDTFAVASLNVDGVTVPMPNVSLRRVSGVATRPLMY
jgi:hypothetical protein